MGEPTLNLFVFLISGISCNTAVDPKGGNLAPHLLHPGRNPAHLLFVAHLGDVLFKSFLVCLGTIFKIFALNMAFFGLVFLCPSSEVAAVGGERGGENRGRETRESREEK